MHLIFDVFYYEYSNEATVACIKFDSFKESNVLDMKTINVYGIEDYESGNFYKRELPCIMKCIDSIDITNIESIIIDGYVFLGNNKEGLGAKLYHELGDNIPIIGIAKNEYKGNNNAIPIVRGSSKKPIFVTSIGIDTLDASNMVLSMKGDFRLPVLVKMVDNMSRNKKSVL